MAILPRQTRFACYCIGRAGEIYTIYDDDLVLRVVADFSAVLRDAAWGRASWEDACRHLAEAFPGSVPIIVNHDFARGVVNSAFMHGMDPDYARSYREYYVSLNPWLGFWGEAPSGLVNVSERDFPSSGFRQTEFYNDWLAPQGNMTAAAGTRVDVDPHNSIQLVWHYDTAMAETYDAPAAAVLDRIRGELVQTVRGLVGVRDAVEGVLRLGPLLETADGAAFLIERDRRIREVNSRASYALHEGEVLAGPGGALSIRDQAAQRWLEETVMRLVDGLPVASTTTAFGLDDRIFGVTAIRAPDHGAIGPALLVRSRPSVLVVVKLLAGGAMRIDEPGLRSAYGLSVAELRLCEILLNGRSLADAAEILGVSDGTIRQRVKMIFHKTRTHRQGELVALLARFGRAGWPGTTMS